ncbi:unnamed protein product [Medioppia subpectinata]|uniref:C2 domain-containing protein n=1 Tax=Medioppia subpectinata TaxID=1979941 RepID=A0A7R9PXG9_9ACAR|nr:unnamed protein product [Medioppia subpectinata]CAG2104808.1 unnamed protein product [Medioppia subpectinata]
MASDKSEGLTICEMTSRDRSVSPLERDSPALNHIMNANNSNHNNSGEIEISDFSAINSELPAIDFKLVYMSQTSTLKMHIKRVNSLPLQFRKNCSSYVKISLITDSEKLSTYHTNVIKKSLNPEYEEDFTFSSLTYEELRNITIRICVYVKRKQLSKRQLVGDLWVPLSRPDLEPDIELNCREKLSLACPQTGKRGPLLMAGRLGFLFIEFQYQTEAQRFKVVYYVIVNVLQNNETVVYKETKCAVGVSPVWNQPFLFDVNETEINTYWIQCLVMQGKSYTKDGVVGQVLIGPNTTVSGVEHWSDVMRSESREMSKWHPIASVGTACL